MPLKNRIRLAHVAWRFFVEFESGKKDFEIQ
jgi:hypothetical protein